MTMAYPLTQERRSERSIPVLHGAHPESGYLIRRARRRRRRAGGDRGSVRVLGV